MNNAKNNTMSMHDKIEAYRKERNARLNSLLESEVNQKREKYQKSHDEISKKLDAAEQKYKEYLDSEDIENMEVQAAVIADLTKSQIVYKNLNEKYANIPKYPDDDLIAIGQDLMKKFQSEFIAYEKKLLYMLYQMDKVIDDLDELVELSSETNTVITNLSSTSPHTVKAMITNRGLLEIGGVDHILEDAIVAAIYRIKDQYPDVKSEFFKK